MMLAFLCIYLHFAGNDATKRRKDQPRHSTIGTYVIQDMQETSHLRMPDINKTLKSVDEYQEKCKKRWDDFEKLKVNDKFRSSYAGRRQRSTGPRSRCCPEDDEGYYAGENGNYNSIEIISKPEEANEDMITDLIKCMKLPQLVLGVIQLGQVRRELHTRLNKTNDNNDDNHHDAGRRAASVKPAPLTTFCKSSDFTGSVNSTEPSTPLPRWHLESPHQALTGPITSPYSRAVGPESSVCCERSQSTTHNAYAWRRMTDQRRRAVGPPHYESRTSAIEQKMGRTRETCHGRAHCDMEYRSTLAGTIRDSSQSGCAKTNVHLMHQSRAVVKLSPHLAAWTMPPRLCYI
ncbi:uncharacterized protein MYCGRDRAFT_111794 [Zymoseptoria tritici IPO323]|uniref:Uncharacterized protein n=1 Tax=Zymoseptoria tritici (strain CBS 115943 / IPO323) TaxID=336722 RepID=F9XS14_ZYMTI|nr:uncharacterized protein MYCGRDRAFT_111794 [Zymoseptoria tritici IPO323]EGP81959.1 hypothetical protein MYCGRDRAFT_111794 [Zymoseptoria tritici IPO323]